MGKEGNSIERMERRFVSWASDKAFRSLSSSSFKLYSLLLLGKEREREREDGRESASSDRERETPRFFSSSSLTATSDVIEGKRYIT